MNFIRNMKTRTKLLVSFIFMAVLVTVLGIMSIYGTQEMSGMFENMYNNNLVPLIDLGKINDELAMIRIRALRITGEADQAQRQKTLDEANESEKEINKTIDKFGATYLTPEEKNVFEQFKAGWAAYNESRLRTFNLALNAKFDEAKQNAQGDAMKKYLSVDEALGKLVGIQDKVGKELFMESVADYKFIRNEAIVLTAVAIIAAIALGLILSRMIASPLQDGVSIAKSIADGDLTFSLNGKNSDRKDEVGELLGAMGRMGEKLKGIMADIRSAADTIASASEELSSSSEQMSRGVADQAGRTSQIATASTEMSQTVVDVAKNASNIATSASDTVKTAQEGESIVNKSVEEVKAIAVTVSESAQLMSSLGERSKQIGDIVSVINDIADQTNLLALNAAIEAARAGEQGRGFAVVADEVRKLAERTAKATSEIGGMIKAIQDEVQKAVLSMEHGTKRVNVGVDFSIQAGNALRGIVDSVNGLQSMVQQIASATEEMSSVSDQISGDIEAVAAVSSETSAASNQIAQSASDLARLSANLTGVVGQFKV